MISKKKRLLTVLTVAVVMVSAILTMMYLKWAGSTRICLIGFRDHQYTKFLDAAEDLRVNFCRPRFEKDHVPDLTGEKIIYIYGMGLRLSPKMRQSIQDAADSGSIIHTFSSSMGRARFSTMDVVHSEKLTAYLNNLCDKNMKGFLKYTRCFIDRKEWFAPLPDEPVILPKDYFFHLDPDLMALTYNEFLDYYKKNNFYKPGAPTVAFFTTVVGPDSDRRGYTNLIIRGLEKRGMNVVPISSWRNRFHMLKEVNPDVAVITAFFRFTFSHSQELTAYLKERKIPLLSPIIIHAPYDEWNESQQGLVGGMLTHSIVSPEMDGGIEPYVVAAQFKDNRNLHVYGPIEQRIDRYCQRVKQWLDLKRMKNSDKKVAVVYYKGPGKNALTAGGLEVVPSLYNMLKALKRNGYTTGLLPADHKALEKILQEKGKVFGGYAQGDIENHFQRGYPQLVPVEKYARWAGERLGPEMYGEVIKQHGQPSMDKLAYRKGEQEYIGVTRVRFGNIVLLPQPKPGAGSDDSTVIHGVKAAPPHSYIAAYLWLKYGFKADALMHFGTHGSLEFTPWKQVALSGRDWPDALAGDIPHFYVYTINNIGEAVLAKRRTYAVILSHLTPPFAKSGLYNDLENLSIKIADYETARDELLKSQLKLSIFKFICKTQINKDLKLDIPDVHSLNDTVLETIHHHLEDIRRENIIMGLHTLGKPYSQTAEKSTARLMSLDALHYTAQRLYDAGGRFRFQLPNRQQHRGKLSKKQLKAMVDARLEEGKRHWTLEIEYAGKAEAKEKQRFEEAAQRFNAVLEQVPRHLDHLRKSYPAEIDAVLTGLEGGYISPSPAGDVIRHPEAAPTGRNLYAIDAERTPTREAWEVGKTLARQLIGRKREQTGDYPKKVAFTLWGGEFIRDKGITIAEIFYLLGVEPVWDMRGIVHDVKLIPMDRLKRPRIDVVAQTSGQFRDAAASRIYLINKAVLLAARADDNGQYRNHARENTLQIEQKLKKDGFSPVKARALSTARVFGGVNGNYGTRIMGLVESGDKWEKDKEISDRYLENMGAVYTQANWGEYIPGVFRKALEHTDTLIHPRSSNKNGPLSLDHVYEFMGGLTATVRNVTGKDPDGFFSDVRNPFKPRLQDLSDAISIESRSTLLNPKFISALKEGEASSAEMFAETFRNTYAWNVMKPSVIDDGLWNRLYDVYIKDSLDLKIHRFFETKNPYALQEMSAVMLETARKGYWKADEKQLKTLARLHAELVIKYNAGCSGFVCNNKKLRKMIKSNLNEQQRAKYDDTLQTTLVSRNVRKGMTLEKQNKTGQQSPKDVITEKKTLIPIILVCLFILFYIAGRLYKRNSR